MRTRTCVHLVQAYPWTRRLPYIGWYGYDQIREDIVNVINFMREEIKEQKKKIDYDAEPATFAAAYLQEIRKRERSGEKDSSFS